MHPKLLVLLIIIPTTSAFVDCRLACRTCRELKAEQSLLEVHCAMCEECKQRRRERMQMKGQQTVKNPHMARQAPSQVKASPPIQYLQPQYPEGCPTPAPCPRSQEDDHAGQISNLDGQAQTCPPADQCLSSRVQYMNSVVTTPPPPIQQAPSTTPQHIPPPIAMPALPPPLPLPMPMPIPPMVPFQHPGVPTAFETTTRETPILNLLSSLSPYSLPSSLFPPPSMMPPIPPPLPFPGLPPLPPMPYPPYYPGCHCMPFVGPGCHCSPFYHRPDSGTAHYMAPFTTERQTISTKEYFYAYVGVPRDILKD